MEVLLTFIAACAISCAVFIIAHSLGVRRRHRSEEFWTCADRNAHRALMAERKAAREGMVGG